MGAAWERHAMCESAFKFMLYNVRNGWANQHGLLVIRYWQENPLVLGKNLKPVSVFPPQISRGPGRDRARASTVRGRRLTAWIMAGSISGLLRFSKYWLHYTQWLITITEKIYLGTIWKTRQSGSWILMLLTYWERMGRKCHQFPTTGLIFATITQ